MDDYSESGRNPQANRAMSTTIAGNVQSSLDPLNVAIARLSDAEVAGMNREDLIDLVNYSVLDRLSMNGRAHLDFVDDSQLKRLACLARFACRRKVNSAFFERGRRPPFIDCI